MDTSAELDSGGDVDTEGTGKFGLEPHAEIVEDGIAVFEVANIGRENGLDSIQERPRINNDRFSPIV